MRLMFSPWYDWWYCSIGCFKLNFRDASPHFVFIAYSSFILPSGKCITCSRDSNILPTKYFLDKKLLQYDRCYTSVHNWRTCVSSSSKCSLIPSRLLHAYHVAGFDWGPNKHASRYIHHNSMLSQICNKHSSRDSPSGIVHMVLKCTLLYRYTPYDVNFRSEGYS